MKRFIDKIQDFYLGLDRGLLLGVLVILGILTFTLNMMWAMPKTFCFLAGALFGWVGPMFYKDARKQLLDTDKGPKSKFTKDSNSQAQSTSELEFNDMGQPKPYSAQSQSLRD